MNLASYRPQMSEAVGSAVGNYIDIKNKQEQMGLLRDYKEAQMQQMADEKKRQEQMLDLQKARALYDFEKDINPELPNLKKFLSEKMPGMDLTGASGEEIKKSADVVFKYYDDWQKNTRDTATR